MAGRKLNLGRADKYFSGAPLDLVKAIEKNRVAEVEALITSGVAVNHRGGEGVTFLAWALAEEKPACFLFLLEKGADPNFPVGKSSTVMSLAALHPDSTYLRHALNHGGKPDLADGDRNRPLVLAAREGRLAHVKLLLQRDAVVDIMDRRGWTALMNAVVYNHAEVVTTLLAAGADPDFENEAHVTARKLAKNAAGPEVRELIDEVEPRSRTKPDE